MKKVLHFITGVEHGGGAENMLLNTLPYLKKTENRVCAVLGHGEVGKKLEEKGVKVYYLDMIGLFDIGVIARYKKIINEFNPDVQVNYLIHADVFGRLFGRLFGVKKIVSYIREKYVNKLHYFLDRSTLFLISYLLTNSVATLDIYQNKFKFSKSKSRAITNGVDLENIKLSEKATDLREELGINKDDFILICVARLHKLKDHQTLLRTVNQIKKTSAINVKLLLCGEGVEKENLKKLSKVLEIENEVLFLGKRSDVYDLLSISDLFVLSSNREGMSNAILEAMALNCPCLVSSDPCNQELIKNEVNGFTFKYSDDKDLTDKIDYIYKNKEVSEKYSKQARIDIEQRYDVKKIISELDNFLEKI